MGGLLPQRDVRVQHQEPEHKRPGRWRQGAMWRLRISYWEIDVERRGNRWLSRQGWLKLLVVFQIEDEDEGWKGSAEYFGIYSRTHTYVLGVDNDSITSSRWDLARRGFALLSVFLSHSSNPMGIVLIPDPMMYHQLPLVLQGSAYHEGNDRARIMSHMVGKLSSHISRYIDIWLLGWCCYI